MGLSGEGAPSTFYSFKNGEDGRMLKFDEAEW